MRRALVNRRNTNLWKNYRGLWRELRKERWKASGNYYKVTYLSRKDTEEFYNNPVPEVTKGQFDIGMDVYSDMDLVLDVSSIAYRDLSVREHEILIMYFEGNTEEEIGKHLGLTQGRISQIFKNIKEVIKINYV